MDILYKYFNQLSKREKVLLTAFIWVLVLAWANMFVGTFKEMRTRLTRTSQELEYQDLWLNNEEAIETALQEALDKVNPELTYNARKLVGQVDNFARQARLNHELSSPKTTDGDIFNLHTVMVTARAKPIDRLIDFEKKLQTLFPYISLDSVRLSANKTNPALLEARFVINSFELNQDATE